MRILTFRSFLVNVLIGFLSFNEIRVGIDDVLIPDSVEREDADGGDHEAGLGDTLSSSSSLSLSWPEWDTGVTLRTPWTAGDRARHTAPPPRPRPRPAPAVAAPVATPWGRPLSEPAHSGEECIMEIQGSYLQVLIYHVY